MRYNDQSARCLYVMLYGLTRVAEFQKGEPYLSDDENPLPTEKEGKTKFKILIHDASQSDAGQLHSPLPNSSV